MNYCMRTELYLNTYKRIKDIHISVSVTSKMEGERLRKEAESLRDYLIPGTRTLLKLVGYPRSESSVN